ncbi:MAG: hypothetical protein K6D03_10300 [Solobacterium sp.]|nr:hypothetical protein [Solobacterium sp.]
MDAYQNAKDYYEHLREQDWYKEQLEKLQNLSPEKREAVFQSLGEEEGIVQMMKADLEEAEERGYEEFRNAYNEKTPEEQEQIRRSLSVTNPDLLNRIESDTGEGEDGHNRRSAGTMGYSGSDYRAEEPEKRTEEERREPFYFPGAELENETETMSQTPYHFPGAEPEEEEKEEEAKVKRLSLRR